MNMTSLGNTASSYRDVERVIRNSVEKVKKVAEHLNTTICSNKQINTQKTKISKTIITITKTNLARWLLETVR